MFKLFKVLANYLEYKKFKRMNKKYYDGGLYVRYLNRFKR